MSDSETHPNNIQEKSFEHTTALNWFLFEFDEFEKQYFCPPDRTVGDYVLRAEIDLHFSARSDFSIGLLLAFSPEASLHTRLNFQNDFLVDISFSRVLGHNEDEIMRVASQHSLNAFDSLSLELVVFAASDNLLGIKLLDKNMLLAECSSDISGNGIAPLKVGLSARGCEGTTSYFGVYEAFMSPSFPIVTESRFDYRALYGTDKIAMSELDEVSFSADGYTFAIDNNSMTTAAIFTPQQAQDYRWTALFRVTLNAHGYFSYYPYYYNDRNFLRVDFSLNDGILNCHATEVVDGVSVDAVVVYSAALPFSQNKQYPFQLYLGNGIASVYADRVELLRIELTGVPQLSFYSGVQVVNGAVEYESGIFSQAAPIFRSDSYEIDFAGGTALEAVLDTRMLPLLSVSLDGQALEEYTFDTEDLTLAVPVSSLLKAVFCADSQLYAQTILGTARLPLLLPPAVGFLPMEKLLVHYMESIIFPNFLPMEFEGGIILNVRVEWDVSDLKNITGEYAATAKFTENDGTAFFVEWSIEVFADIVDVLGLSKRMKFAADEPLQLPTTAVLLLEDGTEKTVDLVWNLPNLSLAEGIHLVHASYEGGGFFVEVGITAFKAQEIIDYSNNKFESYKTSLIVLCILPLILLAVIVVAPRFKRKI